MMKMKVKSPNKALKPIVALSGHSGLAPCSVSNYNGEL